MKNPLIDKEFLKALDEKQVKEVFAKVIALDFEDNPIEEVQGIITQGSINIEGDSAVRRSCSLSIVAQEMDIHEYYWGLKTKFKLFTGITNDIDDTYPDIIWFPQGTYVISSFNTSQGIGSYTISLQGNDKMSLLNGDAGGVITALTVDFGTIDSIDEKGNVTNTDLLLKDIIIEAVHEYAKEPYQNIIINDLDDMGVELLEYRGTKPLYMIVDNDTDIVTNLTLNGSQGGYFKKDTHEAVTLDSLGDGYDHRIQLDLGAALLHEPTRLQVQKNGEYVGSYTVIKVEAGDVVGYRTTGLTYAGDLISNVGEPLTSMLDKIKSMLGDFEYFYNTEGQFIFQRKKTYLQTSFNNIKKDGDGVLYGDNAANTTSFSYSFENSNLISSFTNTPDYANLRNDFSIWGTRTSVNGNELPVHLRCAIDRKPTYYKNINGQVFTTDKEIANQGGKLVDWREIIYQMSLDYYQYGYYTNTEKKIADDRYLAAVRENNLDYYPSGYTGYEQYYTDIYSFWRQLYDPEYEGSYHVTFVTRSEYEQNPGNYYFYQQCNESMPYDKNKQYYVDSVSTGYIKRKITKEKYDANPSNYYFIQSGTAAGYDVDTIYYTLETDEYDEGTWWNRDVSDAPESLNFWFDFLDTEGELSKYSVQNVGIRPKAENNSDVKAIYFREIPHVIFFDETTTDEELIEQREMKQGYTFIKLPEKMENLFSISSQGQSARDMLDIMLYNYAYCVESISISALPVYYLEPNTRIFVRDDKSGINGEYLVERISLPLEHNGMMSISATKAVENMY